MIIRFLSLLLMCSLLSSEYSKNRFPQKYDSGKYIPRFGGEDGRGDLEHANGNIQQLLEDITET